MQVPRPVGTLVVPESVRRRLQRQVRHAHPHEAGGYLDCERRGGRLVATGAVSVDNDADDPLRRFETTVDERAPGLPRVFYHSHTLPSAPNGLTTTDRREIPERYALVLFAPRGEILDRRAFKRGLARWHELTVDSESDGDPTPALDPVPTPR